MFFIYNARRDTVAEKETDIVIPMTLERLLVQRFKKKEMNEKKVTFNKNINVTKQVNSCGRMIYLEFILT